MGRRNLVFVFSLCFLLGSSVAPAAPDSLSLYCLALLRATNGNVRKAIDYVEGQISLRLGPVKLNLNDETTETVLKAADLAVYLKSEGSDPLEKQILADARKRGVVIELANSNQADDKQNRVWIDRALIREGGSELRKVIRHELSHRLYHSNKYLNTEVDEWIFIREVDANLYAGNSLNDAVLITFRNYGGRFGMKLFRYRDPANERDYMATARNIFSTFPQVTGDFALLSKTLSGR